MELTSEQVVEQIKLNIPTGKWVYLWIKPSAQTARRISSYAFGLPPDNSTSLTYKDGWVFAGKLNKKSLDSRVKTYRLSENIDWIIEIAQSYIKSS